MSAIDDLEPEVIEELKKKAIERDEISTEIVEKSEQAVALQGEPEVVQEKPKKSKKVRSAAQIAAFEKAKLKRAENLRLKREQKEQEKEKKKQEKKMLKQQAKEPEVQPEPEPQTNLPLVRQRQAVAQHGAVENPPISTMNPREQVIQNHYYYYGVPPPREHYDKPKKKKSRTGRRPAREKVVEPSSSSEEEDESGGANFVYEDPPSPPVMPDSYKELQEFQEPPPQAPPPKTHPKLKFSFA